MPCYQTNFPFFFISSTLLEFSLISEEKNVVNNDSNRKLTLIALDNRSEFVTIVLLREINYRSGILQDKELKREKKNTEQAILKNSAQHNEKRRWWNRMIYDPMRSAREP